MISYYGSKSKIAKLYPPPIYDTIIEPFCGGAWYSHLHSNKNIILNDKYSILYSIWRWLIDEATEEILSRYKTLALGQDISTLPISGQHKYLLGFLINRGSTTPKSIVQKWSCQSKANPLHASTVEYSINRIVKNLEKIKKWEATNLDYRDLPDIEATWFIDAPYQFGGVHYVENKIDFQELKEWSLSRKGQIIICENDKADWLPFKHLTNICGQKHGTREVFYTNTEILTNIQSQLFAA